MPFKEQCDEICAHVHSNTSTRRLSQTHMNPIFRLQDLFINTVTKCLERKHSKEQEVTSGWFNVEEMANTLGWGKILVFKFHHMNTEPKTMSLQLFASLLTFIILDPMRVRKYIADVIAFCKKRPALVKILNCIKSTRQLFLVIVCKFPNNPKQRCEEHNTLSLRVIRLRKDKYSDKMDKYYVDFKDQSSNKRSVTETETHTQTAKAGYLKLCFVE